MAASGVITRAHRGLYAHKKYAGPLLEDYMEPASGYAIRGTTTLYDDEGNERLRWVKSSIDDDNTRRLAEAAINGLLSPSFGKAKPTKAPKTDTKSLLTTYNIADCHLGMYAYKLETGANYDLEKGEAAIMAAMEDAVDMSVASEHAIVAQLGDFLHIDNQANATPLSGHGQDVDSRYPKVAEVGVRAFRSVVSLALEKHKTVRVICRPGNHDLNSTYLLRAAIAGYFHNEPRVTIDDCDMPLSIVRHGQTLLGYTHGHAPAPNRMVGVLSVDARNLWGQCRHRYIHHGHLHNRRIFEEQECQVECHRAVTSKDRWTAEMGFRSGRDMQTIVYSDETGEKIRYTSPIGYEDKDEIERNSGDGT